MRFWHPYGEDAFAGRPEPGVPCMRTTTSSDSGMPTGKMHLRGAQSQAYPACEQHEHQVLACLCGRCICGADKNIIRFWHACVGDAFAGRTRTSSGSGMPVWEMHLQGAQSQAHPACGQHHHQVLACLCGRCICGADKNIIRFWHACVGDAFAGRPEPGVPCLHNSNNANCKSAWPVRSGQWKLRVI